MSLARGTTTRRLLKKADSTCPEDGAKLRALYDVSDVPNEPMPSTYQIKVNANNKAK